MASQRPSKYTFDRFNDWGYGVRAELTQSDAYSSAPPTGCVLVHWASLAGARAQVQCCVWTAALVGPLSVVAGVVLLVRAAPPAAARSEPSACPPTPRACRRA